MTMRPIFLMLAGPNGAGKSTFYEAYLAHLDLPFLNADVLAKAFRLDAYAASAETARLRDRLLEEHQSFITESVFSDPIGEKVSVLANAARNGYDVELIYIGLSSAALSMRRVADRVQAGGHPVPAEKIKGRYSRSLTNLKLAIERLPRVRLHDNSTYQAPHQFVAEFREGQLYRCGNGTIPSWARDFVPVR
jgi:predicted ABC-type ATPase